MVGFKHLDCYETLSLSTCYLKSSVIVVVMASVSDKLGAIIGIMLEIGQANYFARNLISSVVISPYSLDLHSIIDNYSYL